MNCYFYIAAEDDELGPDGKKLRPGISSKIIEELTDCNAALSQQRKRRQVLYPPMRILNLSPQDILSKGGICIVAELLLFTSFIFASYSHSLKKLVCLIFINGCYSVDIFIIGSG